MATGKILHSISRVNFKRRLSRDKLKGTNLCEHIVYRIRRDAVAFEVDESYLLESVHNFVGCFPLLGERVRISEFAKVNQGNPKLLVRTSVLSNNNQRLTGEILWPNGSRGHEQRQDYPSYDNEHAVHDYWKT
jgi:hypothetical protein